MSPRGRSPTTKALDMDLYNSSPGSTSPASSLPSSLSSSVDKPVFQRSMTLQSTIPPYDLELAQEVSYLRERVDKLEGVLQSICGEISNFQAQSTRANNFGIGECLQRHVTTALVPAEHLLSNTKDYMQGVSLRPKYDTTEMLAPMADNDLECIAKIVMKERTDIAEDEAKVQRPHKSSGPSRFDFQDTFPWNLSEPTTPMPFSDIRQLHNGSGVWELGEKLQPRSKSFPWHQKPETCMAQRQLDHLQIRQHEELYDCQHLQERLSGYRTDEFSTHDRPFVEANHPDEVCEERDGTEVDPDFGLLVNSEVKGLHGCHKISM